MRKFIEPLAWLVSISLIVYAVYWAVGPSIVKPSYASAVPDELDLIIAEIAKTNAANKILVSEMSKSTDRLIQDMNEAAPKFPRIEPDPRDKLIAELERQREELKAEIDRKKELADQQAANARKLAETRNIKFPPRARLAADVKILLDQSHGSGFFINDNLVVTAAHVVNGKSKRLDLRMSDGSLRKATVLWTADTSDIALLAADGTDVAPATIACEAPKVGDEITMVGNPLSLEKITAFGRIAGDELKIGHWDSVMVVSGPVIPGQSGGAAYNSKGEVVGVTVGLPMWPAGFVALPTGYGFLVAGPKLCQLLARV